MCSLLYRYYKSRRKHSLHNYNRSLCEVWQLTYKDLSLMPKKHILFDSYIYVINGVY